MIDPVNTTQWKRTIRDWCKAATGLQPRWAQPGDPEPSFPYCLMNIVSSPVGDGVADIEEYTTNGDDLDIDIHGWRTALLSIRFASIYDKENPDKSQAMAYANRALAYLDTESVKASFVAANMAIVNRGPIADLSNLRSGKPRKFVNLDLTIRLESNLSDTVGRLKQAEFDLDIDGNDEGTFLAPETI